VSKPLLSAAILLLVFAFAGTLDAQTYPLQQQNVATAGFNSGGVANCQRGWRFQCNAAGVSITRLGCWYPDGASQSKTVTLFNWTTQAILAQVTCGPGSGWQFTDLATPVALTNGAQYVIQGFTTTNSYYFGTIASVGTSWAPTGTIQYLDMRYSNSSTANTFPTSVLSNYQYGIVDFGYTTGPSVYASTSTLNLGTTPQGTAGTTQTHTGSGYQTPGPPPTSAARKRV